MDLRPRVQMSQCHETKIVRTRYELTIKAGARKDLLARRLESIPDDARIVDMDGSDIDDDGPWWVKFVFEQEKADDDD